MKKTQSLKARLWKNTGALLVLLFVLGVSSVFALNQNLSALGLIRDENKSLSDVSHVTQGILQMRLNVNSYLRTDKDEFAQVALGYGNDALAILKKTVAEEKDAHHLTLEKESIALLERYIEAIDESRADAATYSEGAGVMRDVGKQVLKGVDGILASAYETTDLQYQKDATNLRFALLEGRLAAVKFREKSSEDSAKAAIASLNTFRDSFNSIKPDAKKYGASAAVKDVEDSAGLYIGAFEDVAASKLQKLARVEAIMAPVGVELLEKTTQITSETEEGFGAVITGSVAQNKMVMGAVLVIVVIAVAVGSILSMFLANSVVRSIQTIIDSLTHSSTQVGSAANEISSSSQNLAEAASEQAATIEETSASMEEISSMVKSNATAVEQVRDRSVDATKAAADGNERMKELERKLLLIRDAGNALKEAMGQISKSSKEVAVVAATIDEIAFQTNLLSLNAAVEAARAGEAGAGFAVVAGEVGQLAQRSAQNATQTTQLIAQSEESSKAGVVASDDVLKSLDAATVLFEEVIKAFDSITQQVGEVSTHAEEVRLSSVQQTQGIDQINIAIGQLDQVIQQNAATSEESAGAAAQLTSQSSGLLRMVEQLREVVYGSGSSSSVSAGLDMGSSGGSDMTIQSPRNKQRGAFMSHPGH